MASQSLPQSLSRRTVVLDLESVSLTADPRGALDAMTGRVVCIGLLFEDGQKLTPAPVMEQDETKLLERFWSSLSETDLLVGHNILEFDLMFLRQRSWILGVRPPFEMNLKKYYTTQVCDLMSLWTNWSNRFKGAGLDNIAQALGCGQKTGNGSDVAGMWARGEYVRIMDYCMSDVWLAYQCYCKMHYRQPIGLPLPVFNIPQRELVQVAASKSAAVAAGTPYLEHLEAQSRDNPIESSAPQEAPAPPRRRRIEGQRPRQSKSSIPARMDP